MEREEPHDQPVAGGGASFRTQVEQLSCVLVEVDGHLTSFARLDGTLAAQTTRSFEVAAFLTALREQLGFRLESARGRAEVFVIDRIERPTPD